MVNKFTQSSDGHTANDNHAYPREYDRTLPINYTEQLSEKNGQFNH